MKTRSACRRILFAVAILVGAVGPATASDADWSVSLAAMSSHSTSGSGSSSSLGVGATVEYRFSRSLGVGVVAFSNQFDDELEFDLYDFPIRLESNFRMTPVLAELLWHLTPDSRADLYIGPVAGYVVMSDLAVRADIVIYDEPQYSQWISFPTRNSWAWGGTVGVNVRLGSGGSFLTLGATYLEVPLDFELAADLVESAEIDPLALHLGYGFRF